jgi:peptidoglycan/LPS O-acetylase OafA/YrhL
MTTEAAEARRAHRFVSLDVWRGVACLSVAVFHSSGALDHLAGSPLGGIPALLIRQLWIGVPLFFVISGYCIAAASNASRHTDAPVARFFQRRLRRIYPPYWTLLAFAVVVSTIAYRTGWVHRFSDPPLADPGRLAWQQWLGNATLTEIARFHFSAVPSQVFLGHAWTLMYEEQFYCICGVLLLLCPRRFFLGTALVTLITCCVAPWTFKNVGINTFGLFCDGRWLVFMAGVLVYYAVNHLSPAHARIVVALLGVSTLAACVFFVGLEHRYVAGTIGPDQRQLGIEFVVGVAFALVLLATHRWDVDIATSRWTRPLVFCGRMCYSIYLVHLPFTNVIGISLRDAGVNGFWGTLLITIPIGVAVSVGAGWCFFHGVEKHFLNRQVDSDGLRQFATEPRLAEAAANAV